MAVFNFDVLGLIILLVSVVLIAVGTYYQTKWSVQPSSQQYILYTNMIYISSFLAFIVLARLFFLFNSLSCSAYVR